MSFIHRLITTGQEIMGATPARAAVPAYVPVKSTTQGYNPFMSAMDSESAEYRDMYGVNRPLPKPMFLGYRDNQALYGGSRLFILY